MGGLNGTARVGFVTLGVAYSPRTKVQSGQGRGSLGPVLLQLLSSNKAAAEMAAAELEAVGLSASVVNNRAGVSYSSRNKAPPVSAHPRSRQRQMMVFMQGGS